MNNCNVKMKVNYLKYSSGFYKFMRGRYGIDSLYRFLLIIYFVLVIINMFLSSKVIRFVELFILFFSFYRVFSKKIYRRRKEEVVYLKIKNIIISFFKKKRNNYYNNYIYRKCYNCKVKLRLPLPDKRGFHTVKCPKCHKRLKVFTLRKNKIEVIRKKVVE